MHVRGKNCIQNSLLCSRMSSYFFLDAYVCGILSLVDINMMDEVGSWTCHNKEIHPEFVRLIFVVLSQWTKLRPTAASTFIKGQSTWTIMQVLSSHIDGINCMSQLIAPLQLPTKAVALSSGAWNADQICLKQTSDMHLPAKPIESEISMSSVLLFFIWK